MAAGANCRSGCRTRDHLTWGECARAAHIRLSGLESLGVASRDTQKAWDKELADYRSAREQGVQPAGTSAAKVAHAMKWSEAKGRAFNADSVDAVTA